MPATWATWHGDQAEGCALADATKRYCTCESDPETGRRTSTCPVHVAVVQDQRFLDGLLFMRHRAQQLLREEFATVEARG